MQRPIDGAIINSVATQQFSGPREEFEVQVKNVMQLEEIRFGLIRTSPDL